MPFMIDPISGKHFTELPEAYGRLQADFNDCNQARDHWKQEAERLRGMILWMGEQDYYWLEQAEEKFGPVVSG
jgi:hypothetical protein